MLFIIFAIKTHHNDNNVTKVNMALCFCSLYIILVAIVATIAVADDQDEKIGSSACPSKEQQQQQQQHNHCTLYLAESSIPNAGLGIYSGVQLGINETLMSRHLSDVVIPIYDIELHNDYNNKFQWVVSDYSWLASKLGVDIEAKRVTALAPGLGALANNHHALANIAFNGFPLRDYDDEQEGLHHHPTSSGSITPYYDLKHYATSSIEAGSELFHDYGARWGEKRVASLGPIPLKEHYKKADKIIDCFRIFLINASLSVHDTLAKDIWNNNVRLVRNNTANNSASTLDGTSHLGAESEKIITPALREMLLTRSCQAKDVRTEAALNFPYSAMEDAMEIGSARAYLQLQNYIRPLSWLEENGRCIDGLSIAPSSSILHNNGGGRGAFASRNFNEFDIITTTPLLPINRTLLETYQFSMNHPGKQRKLSTTKFGRQLLLNYCHGHRDSSLLFFPYGPAVNMINHGGKNSNTNARIQFSNFSSFHHDEWKSYSVEDILNKDKSTRLIFDIIATKSIQSGDEIFLDYGKEWETAWELYVNSWNPPGDGVQFSNQNKNKKPYTSDIHRPSAFRKSIGMSDELFPETWRDITK